MWPTQARLPGQRGGVAWTREQMKNTQRDPGRHPGTTLRSNWVGILLLLSPKHLLTLSTSVLQSPLAGLTDALSHPSHFSRGLVISKPDLDVLHGSYCTWHIDQSLNPCL